jgi:drug/metabolite transporter (DMT)-like permease
VITVPVALALLSSLLWGTSDFLGGTATKRLRAGVVVFASQLVALVALIPFVVLLGERPDAWWPGVAAGLTGVVGLAAFYAALAVGTMGVVAPIAATGAVVPVVVGLAQGEAPSGLQVAGIAVALIGVVLASGPELTGGAPRRPLLLAVVSAVCFGSVAVLIAEGSEGPAGGALVSLAVMRVASVTALGLVGLVRRTRVPVAGSAWVLVAIGLFDVGANTAFAYASRQGLLSVVAVLASLYPVVTVLLAREVHGERLARVQVVGAAGTLVGVALLSAG